MNRKTTGVVAVAAGAALLLGGATFGLWSDTSSVDGGTLTAGNLEVGTVTQQWRDVSEDRSDSPHTIDLATFRIVPGDVIEGTYSAPVALEGDNMVADLSLGHFGGHGESLWGKIKQTTTYTVTVGDQVIVAERRLVDGEQLRFASWDNKAPGELRVFPRGSHEVKVVVTIGFPDLGAQELAEAHATLDDFTVTLTQVRDAGPTPSVGPTS